MFIENVALLVFLSSTILNFVINGSKFMEGGGTPPPQYYNEIRKPSAYRVNKSLFHIRMVLFNNL